jgi:predicted O-methyltransferase YrrM
LTVLRAAFAKLAKLLLLALLRSRVAAGPFAGLRYLGSSSGSCLGAKLIGTYELELQPLIRRLKASGIRHFIDVGAAEGYYAVGLLRMAGAGASLTAFEFHEDAQRLTARLATKNGVAEQLTVLGACDPPDLQRALDGLADPVFVLCDVEGHESVLLDLELVPDLKRAFVLVELHEVEAPGITAKVRERFQATHTVKEIVSTPRRASDLPLNTWWTKLLPESAKMALMDEHRPRQMSWFWLQPMGRSLEQTD